MKKIFLIFVTALTVTGCSPDYSQGITREDKISFGILTFFLIFLIYLIITDDEEDED